MATLEERLDQLETQQGLTTEALRQILEGHWLGADGAAGTVVALMGGTVPGFSPHDFPSGVRTRLMLDRASAPGLEIATQLRDTRGVEVWGVYVGGPTLAVKAGWNPQHVQNLSQIGMRFLPIYAGQQKLGTLTAERGNIDGADALACMAHFGWEAGAPVCLDVEADTFDAHPAASLTYACAWVRTVRAGGFRPGIYAAPRTLVALDQAQPPAEEMPDFIWAASDTANGLVEGLDLAHIKNLPDDLWSGRGERAWQYAISVASEPVFLDGLEVDISLTSVSTAAPGAA